MKLAQYMYLENKSLGHSVFMGRTYVVDIC